MKMEGRFTSPKDEKLMNVGTVRAWMIQLVFDKEIDPENVILTAGDWVRTSRLKYAIFPSDPQSLPWFPLLETQMILVS